ncbi:MAG TPA: PIG-L family deacetylase [Acidimicrobiia bacterium]|nr:PIG-L family deacetylase [Acidimicrobiia bacterium]
MILTRRGAQIYVPDGTDTDEAIARTTHMAIGAHQDDIPIMAHHGILECFGRDDHWFAGITVTDGAGSPRAGLYGDYTDSQMQAVRIIEEKKAAHVGEYGAAVLLDYPSSAVKNPADASVADELAHLIAAAHPDVIYTHNLADKHDTHVAVALRTIAALRSLPREARPSAVYGCEVWRDLDWLADADKIAFDVSAHENLAAAVLGVYDSQISGGKRYDLATAGRRLAHATFSESHSVDTAQALIYGMDLTPLVEDPYRDIDDFVRSHIERMQLEISMRITTLLGGK